MFVLAAQLSSHRSQFFKHMKCLVKEDVQKNGLSFRQDVPEPTPKFNEVKIRVLAAAVCGTDKSIFNSGKSEGMRREMQRHLSAKPYKPIIVGHEFCGVIEEVGEGVEEDNWLDVPNHLILEKGDYVTAEMHLFCGHCRPCRTGSEHVCINLRVKGVHLDGCFAQSVVVPYKNVILLGKDGDQSLLTPRLAAMLDAFGNALHTVQEADIRGKSVAILGAGPLGLMATFLCHDFGAARIYLTELADVDHRFRLGKEFGADECIDVSSGSDKLYRAVEKFEANSNGVDLVLEMSGSPSAYLDAFRIVRNGGTILLLGITHKPLSEFDVANGIIWKGVTVKGIFGRKMFDTWETMLRLLRSPRFDLPHKLSRLLGERDYCLDEYQEAFTRLTEGIETKLVFEPQKNSRAMVEKK